MGGGGGMGRVNACKVEVIVRDLLRIRNTNKS